MVIVSDYLQHDKYAVNHLMSCSGPSFSFWMKMSVILRKWFSSLMVHPVNSNSASSSQASHCSTET